MPGYARASRWNAPLLGIVDGLFGFSDAASRVEDKIERALTEFTLLRREPLVTDIVGLWDESSLRTDANLRKTAAAAICFALLLPRSLPDPEVSLDPDGEISFDWSGNGGERFSVSVNGARRLAFAGRFSETSKLHGVEQLSKAFPSEIIRGIQKTTCLQA
jgi:hypothetical protein